MQVGAFDFSSRVVVTARFEDAAGLGPGAMVSVSGVQVGTVEGLTVDHDEAVVTLAVYTGSQVKRGALARIRSRSVLGEKYVQLIPGSDEAGLLEDGDVIETASNQTEIDELVDMLGPILSAIDPEDVSTMMRELSTTIQEDPERLSRMLKNADTLLDNGVKVSRDLPDVLDQTSATLRDARRMVAEIRETNKQGQALLVKADVVLEDIHASTDDLPKLVNDVELTLEQAQKVMEILAASSEDVEVILNNLKEIDKWELRRLLREEGIRVRFRTREVDPEQTEYSRHGRTK